MRANGEMDAQHDAGAATKLLLSLSVYGAALLSQHSWNTTLAPLTSCTCPTHKLRSCRTGAIKAKKIDSKQIPRIQSKLDAIMRQLPYKSSLTLTRENVLKRWVSGVWLKVEL